MFVFCSDSYFDASGRGPGRELCCASDVRRACAAQCHPAHVAAGMRACAVRPSGSVWLATPRHESAVRARRRAQCVRHSFAAASVCRSPSNSPPVTRGDGTYGPSSYVQLPYAKAAADGSPDAMHRFKVDRRIISTGTLCCAMQHLHGLQVQRCAARPTHHPPGAGGGVPDVPIRLRGAHHACVCRATRSEPRSAGCVYLALGPLRL